MVCYVKRCKANLCSKCKVQSRGLESCDIRTTDKSTINSTRLDSIIWSSLCITLPGSPPWPPCLKQWKRCETMNTCVLPAQCIVLIFLLHHFQSSQVALCGRVRLHQLPNDKGCFWHHWWWVRRIDFSVENHFLISRVSYVISINSISRSRVVSMKKSGNYFDKRLLTLGAPLCGLQYILLLPFLQTISRPANLPTPRDITE